MDWYYEKWGTAAGPVDEKTLDDYAKTGRLTGKTLVWNATMEGWKPASGTTLAESFPKSEEHSPLPNRVPPWPGKSEDIPKPAHAKTKTKNQIVAWSLFVAGFAFLVFAAGLGKLSFVRRRFGWLAVIGVLVVVGIVGALWDCAVDEAAAKRKETK